MPIDPRITLDCRYILMADTDYLSARFPNAGKTLRREKLADLPTPVADVPVDRASGRRTVSVKHDNLTGDLYGGNKVRKLEYLLRLACDKGCKRVATFGSAGSNHALATSLYARKLGLDCTCFLSHQARTPLAPATLNMHIRNGTELVRYGGTYATRIATLRENLWGRNAWVVPMGGSSWLGAVGFVNAGLELADQVACGSVSLPDRLYVATGTMGTAAGLAIGLALANLPTEVQAVRVSDPTVMNEKALHRLIGKTVSMLHRIDSSVPADLAGRVHIVVRHDYFAGGYAETNAATDAAVDFGNDHLGIKLETTYTGKAMAALLNDLDDASLEEKKFLFWNTYSSADLPVPNDKPLDEAALPEEFMRYFE
jgi:1-aminocyclopropane-1-carboxylate deaminase/D-cysteine desulfhydrase-like pyridoxal-dependent ACC family enzyme